MNAMEFAIKMENDAEKYYTQQAKLSEESGIENLWLRLAKDEKIHAEILRKAYNNVIYELPESELYLNKEKGIKDIGKAINQRKDAPTQINCYKIAIEKEIESINLYTDLRSQAKTDAEEALFEFFVREEKNHYEILDGLIQWLTQSEEIVESAEFGIKKDDLRYS